MTLHYITIIYLVQKETQCFYLQFFGLKNIDFKNYFNSVVLLSDKDLFFFFCPQTSPKDE